MKNFVHMTLIAFTAFAAASCSVKEDWEGCVDPGPVYVYLTFECIEIYDKPEIVFDKVTRELELLFYYPDGVLAYDLRYTAAELERYHWMVRLHDNMVKAGNYTLLALVNYDNDHYTLTGKHSLETLLAGLDHQGPEIDFPLTDTYYGLNDLELRYSPSTNRHTIFLSKNTNYFNLTLLFPDAEHYDNVTSVGSRITGNNTIYRWDNTAVELPAVSYVPFRSSYGDPDKTYTDLNKTMRVWHGSDLVLELKITTPDGVYGWSQPISDWLAGIEKYDTDEKLEHYDEFNITIKLGDRFAIISVQVNGWYVVKNGEDL